MVDLEQVNRHPFFRKIGCFSVDLTSPRDGMRAVDYAADLLRGNAGVIIFPQGKIEPNDVRPLKIHRGVEAIIARVPGAVVWPISLRCDFWLEQRAEAMVHLAPRQSGSDGLAETLQAGLDTLQAAGRNSTEGLVALRGRASISHWKDRFKKVK